MSKEKRDEVIKYLKNGYNIGETAKKTGTSRGYVSKINKEVVHKTENTLPRPIMSTLSEESIQILQNIQGLFGCKNLDETVSQLNEDIRSIMPRKYEFDFDFNKSIGGVFEELYDKYRENKLFRKILERITLGKNDEIKLL